MSGYDVKNDVVEFFSRIQSLSSSKPTRFNYPHWHGVGSHQEFEGVVTKLEWDDEAGRGSGMEYPSFPYTMEFTVGKSENPLA